MLLIVNTVKNFGRIERVQVGVHMLHETILNDFIYLICLDVHLFPIHTGTVKINFLVTFNV